MKDEILICDCSSAEHQMVLRFDDDKDLGRQVFVEIHLVPLVWYKRLWLGLKYIFGYKCCYGNFDEMILSPKHARQVYNLYRFLNKPNLESDETMREKDEIDQAFINMRLKGELKFFTTNWPDCCHSTIVYIDGDQIVATCMVTYEGKDKKEAVLWNLQVKKDYRNYGLGKLLMKAAIDDAVLHRCPSIDLEWSPMDSVGWVFDWYKSYGFRVVSCDSKVRMTKKLYNVKGGQDDSKD